MDTKIPDGGGGWKGDVKNTLLNIGKINTLGWKPKHNTQQAIRKATKANLRILWALLKFFILYLI